MINDEFARRANIAYSLPFLISLRNGGIKQLLILKNYSLFNFNEVNENMPIRFLEYVARLYEQIQEPRDRYLRKLKKIPTPEFFVFYNGKEDFPAAKTLKLSDAFMNENTKPNLELVVQVININLSKKNKIVENCKPLAEYSLFVETVRRHTQTDAENGFKNAIKECMQNDILKDYLQRKSKEVMNMLVCEYNYAEDIATQREEERRIAFSDGAYQTKLETASAFKKMGIPIAKIVEETGLSKEEIEKL